MLWLAFAVLAACAALLLALPFMQVERESVAEDASLAHDAAQLSGVDREQASGEIDATAADELRAEIALRILAAATPSPALERSQPKRAVAAGVSAFVVLGAAGLYAVLGSPNLAHPRGDAAQQTDAIPDIDAVIARLHSRLETAPDDALGWRLLGWAYFETGRYDDAVASYGRAVSLAPEDAGYRSALAEAITHANGGMVSPEALSNFQQALSLDQSDERARYYRALAKAQSGDIGGAVNDWIAAANDAAPDSQWAPQMRASAEAAAERARLNIQGRIRTPSAVPPAADAEAGAEQRQIIAAMVDGLDLRLRDNPRDAEGWMRLMRSRMVLNQPERAQAALGNALRAFEGDAATQARLRAAAAELNVPGA